MYWIPLVINIFLAAAIVFLERRHVAATWAWLLVLVFLPIVGFIIYIVFGQNLSKIKIFRFPTRFFEEYGRMIEVQYRHLKAGEFSFNDAAAADNQAAIMLNLVHGKSLFSQDNAVDIYTDGKAKFEALLRDIDAAEHHIHMLYYIYRNDEIGRTIRDRLVMKAKAGVEVRVLIDDMGSSRLPRSFFRPLLEAGGQAAAFFPSNWLPYLNFRVNYRNHRKMVIIDGQVGYIGGFNIGDEYLGLNRKFGYWRDTHIRISGSAVDSLQIRFLLDWNNASTRKMKYDRRYFPVKQTTGTAGMQIVSSGPDSDQEQIKDGMLKLIYATRKSIFIQTPYFVPDESMLGALKIAALSGVDVRIMIPNKPDHPFVYWASWSYLGKLLRHGVRAYIYDRGFIHAKTIVMDGQTASVGTSNFDVRSFKLNFEVNAFIFHTETAGKLHDIFLADMAHARELTWEEYERRRWIIRFKESVSRLLSPIL